MKLKTMVTTLFCGLLLIGCVEKKVDLGEKLYSDANLSKDKTMSCATCHNLKSGFTDIRSTNLNLGASLGDNMLSIADRNAPTIGYAKFTPKFHFDKNEKVYVGGQFLDGRAKTLEEQTRGPLLNPVEMNMPNEIAIINRIKENKEYVRMFKKIYGPNIFDNVEKAYNAVIDSIVAFEKSEIFSPFDSKYDKMLRGIVTLTNQESQGLKLFKGKAKCKNCHPLTSEKNTPALFTDFTYDNLGVPVNPVLRKANGKEETYIDKGLYENPKVHNSKYKGAFRVTSLRNIAVTGPYMHNGVFKNLATVVHFYNTRDVIGAINPETGKAWGNAEIKETKNIDEMGNLKLLKQEEDALVAFLKTLTDEKFEHLIP